MHLWKQFRKPAASCGHFFLSPPKKGPFGVMTLILEYNLHNFWCIRPGNIWQSEILFMVVIIWYRHTLSLESFFYLIFNHMQHVFLRQIITIIHQNFRVSNFLGLVLMKLSRLNYRKMKRIFYNVLIISDSKTNYCTTIKRHSI